MTVLDQLAAFTLTAKASELPDSDRDKLHRHVADTLVAAAAGASTSEGRALRQVLPHTTFADTAGMLAALIRHTEIDDIHTRSCTTPSSVTVPTALALARALDQFEPDEVASAIWVGTELMAGLGTAIDGARILYRGVWPTYFTAPLAAAAVAARMMGLTEIQAAHALSLALMLTAGRSGRFHGALPGRSVILAMAVANGVRAADAARNGVGGDPALLDGPWLKDAHGLNADMTALTAELGGRSIYRELSLKPFCSAKQALAAVEAFAAIIDEGVRPESITAIKVRVPPPYARMIAMKPEAGVRASSIVSAAFQIGLAACRRDRLYDIERADALRETAALDIAARVTIEADEALLATFPAAYPAVVEVTTASGTQRREVTVAAGDPGRELDNDALRQKAEKVIAAIGGRTPANALVESGLTGFDSAGACRALAERLWNSAFER